MLQKHLSRLSPGIFTSVVTLAILWLTLAPHPLPETDTCFFAGADKIVHSLMFGGLVFAMVFDRELLRQRRYEQTGRMPRKGVSTLVMIAAVATMFGGIIEFLQAWMELGRGCDPLDFIADGFGASISALVSPRLTALLLQPR